jgi:hypothetical protein
MALSIEHIILVVSIATIKWPWDIYSIQFKVLFRVDINHTYNTSSNELLKSTMVYNNTYNHAYKHIK